MPDNTAADRTNWCVSSLTLASSRVPFSRAFKVGSVQILNARNTVKLVPLTSYY
jgi:hypothetical protein